MGEGKEGCVRVGEKGLELGDREIGLSERDIGEGVSNQVTEIVVVGVCDVGDGITCPSMCTGEKDGASGENTIAVVGEDGVVVGGVFG